MNINYFSTNNSYLAEYKFIKNEKLENDFNSLKYIIRFIPFFLKKKF